MYSVCDVCDVMQGMGQVVCCAVKQKQNLVVLQGSETCQIGKYSHSCFLTLSVGDWVISMNMSRNIMQCNVGVTLWRKQCCNGKGFVLYRWLLCCWCSDDLFLGISHSLASSFDGLRADFQMQPVTPVHYLPLIFFLSPKTAHRWWTSQQQLSFLYNER